MALRYFFIQKLVKEGRITVKYVKPETSSLDDQTAGVPS